MTRVSELFAGGAILLLAGGIASVRLPLLKQVTIDVALHDVFYVFRPQVGFFACAALFAASAFVYSLSIVRMNSAAAGWHFWLTTASVLLMIFGFVGISAVTSTGANSLLGKSAIVSTLLSYVLFFAAQVVFAANLVTAFLHTGARSRM